MQLIASPHLYEEDIIDIERGYSTREVIERATLRELDPDQPDRLLDGLGMLGRLIAAGQLDIKLAFVEQEGRIGIYHEKLGVFRDDAGDLVGFTGSSNETYGGLAANFESVEVYKGWVAGDGARALRLEEDFLTLWTNQTPQLKVESFPDIARDRLVKLGHDRHRKLAPRSNALEPPKIDVYEPNRLAIPGWLTVRDYQRHAVECWLRNQARGVLKMATGTGKTKTALIAATQLGNALRQSEQPLIVLVVAPFQHLVDQWIVDFQEFGVRPVPIYESSQKWLPVIEDQLAASRMGQRPITAMVATNASFAGDKFQSVISRVMQPLLLIADEAHNLGSTRYRAALPSNATYRLALSATPERWLDEEGTDALRDYFGPIVFELDLGEAIRRGALTPYYYTPRLVELTPAETELYVDLTKQIAACIAAGEDIETADSSSQLGSLLRQRSAVLGHAEGKLSVLETDLTRRREQWFQLVYCAEGRRPTGIGEFAGPNQVKQTMNLVGNKLRLSAHTYISDTPREERKTLLKRFSSGKDLRVLVAMRCLDEGVDIPDARVGYILASSSNPRQFIQRRGRLLRRAEGKDHAEILDYLAVPPADTPINFDVERALLTRELQRANEFGKLSKNYEATLEVLRPLKERYQLMDL